MFTYYSFQDIYTYISEHYFQNDLCLLGNPFLLFCTAFLS